MARLTDWIAAARPRTLSAAVAPVVMGSAMAYDAGGFHGPSAIAALLGAMLIQIGTNFANDYYDFVKGADTAERAGPTRATAAGLIAPQTMRCAMIVTFACVFVPGAYILYRGGVPFLIIGLVSVACGVLYTGGPYPLAYLGLGDLFVLIFFGPVALGGTYYLQTTELSPMVVVAGLSPGLFSTAILTVNNLRDIHTDAKAGKKTLAVRFGQTFARWEYIACVLVGGIAVPLGLCVTMEGHWFSLFAAVPALYLLYHGRILFTTDPGPHLNATLSATGQALLGFAIIFSLGRMM